MFFQELSIKIALFLLGAVSAAASILTMPNTIVILNTPSLNQTNVLITPTSTNASAITSSSSTIAKEIFKKTTKLLPTKTNNKTNQTTPTNNQSQSLTNQQSLAVQPTSSPTAPMVLAFDVPNNWPPLVDNNYFWTTNAVAHGVEADPPGETINIAPQSPVWKVSWSSSTKNPLGQLYPPDNAFTIKVLNNGREIYSWSSYFDKETGNYIEGGQKIFGQKGDQLVILASAATGWSLQVFDGYPNNQ